MKKNLRRELVFAVMLLALPLAVFSESGYDWVYDFEADGLYYKIYNREEAWIAEPNDSANYVNVTVPPTVDYEGKTYPVVGIESRAFSARRHPGCSTLETVALPEGIRKIGNSAFEECRSLRQINLPPSLEYIGNCAFSGCISLRHVTLPPSLKKMEIGAFMSTGLEEIYIPDSYECIESGTFSWCQSLKSVRLPESRLKIDGSAFYKCTSLESIDIPSTTYSIGPAAFYGCGRLTTVVLPDSAEVSGGVYGETFHEFTGGTFAECTSLESVILPPGMTKMGQELLAGCGRLKSVVIPPEVTEIGSGALWRCGSLTSVTVPSKVSSIGWDPFGDCENLREILVEDGNGHFMSRDGVLYTSDGKTLVQCPAAVTEVSIPETVEKINVGAFNGCRLLESINIPEGAEMIRYTFHKCTGLRTLTLPSTTAYVWYALGYCTSLQSIYLKAEEPPQYDELYTERGDRVPEPYNNPDIVLYVPVGSADRYREDDGWGKFRDIREMDFSGVEDVVEPETSVRVEHGTIVVGGTMEGERFEVYDMSGRVVFSGKGPRAEGLSKGIYVVKAGDVVKRVSL